MSKYAKDKYCYSVQENNTVEWIVQSSGRASYLESCGPNSLENCAAAMWHYDKIVDIVSVGPFREKFQPADLIFTHMNDPLRRKEYNKILNLPDGEWRNRYAIYYPYVAGRLFDMRAEYVERLDFGLLEDHLKKGNTAQICLIEPGHYLAIVDVDEEGTFYFHDSWPGRFQNRDGFYRPITRNELLYNAHKFMILYYKE